MSTGARKWVISGLLLVVGLVTANCNHQASLEAWCQKTSQCLCTADVCCVLPTFECGDEAPCCTGATCQSGRCASTPDAGG